MGPVTQRALFLAGLLAAASASQDIPAFRSNVELVTIPCAVVDARGAPVEGLTREDFRVTDNGVRRVIEHLWLDADQPVTLGVAIDASDSQQGQFTEHRETALKILARLRRPGDRTFAIQVAEDVRLWPDLAGTPAGELFGQPCPKQQSNMPGLRAESVCGGSPLWNAVYDAARLKLLAVTGTKALLILTDGFDTGSTHTWRQAADEAHKAEATVYAIQYPSAFGGTYAPDLYRLVVETGGASFQAPDGDYDPLVSRLQTDLRRRYVLGFRPEKLSGKVRHEVEVEVTRPDLTVRARKVYFEAPQ